MTDALLCLNDVDVFHDLLVSKYLEDVLGALFQLSYAPLKKPVKSQNYDANAVADLDSFDEDFEITEMTFSIWRRLEENKMKYKNSLDKLEEETYKPLIIHKFLVLLGTKVTCEFLKQQQPNILP